ANRAGGHVRSLPGRPLRARDAARSAPPGERDGAAAVRPRTRSALPRRAGAARAGRPRRPLRLPPRDLRRLVDRRLPARARRVVRGPAGGEAPPATSLAAAAPAERRFRGLAAEP